jgi:hypothetical protein
MSRDYDFTDWDAVDAFALSLGASGRKRVAVAE